MSDGFSGDVIAKRRPVPVARLKELLERRVVLSRVRRKVRQQIRDPNVRQRLRRLCQRAHQRNLAAALVLLQIGHTRDQEQAYWRGRTQALAFQVKWSADGVDGDPGSGVP